LLLGGLVVVVFQRKQGPKTNAHLSSTTLVVNNCKKLWLALRWKDDYDYDYDDVFSVQLTSLSNFETKEMSITNLFLRLADGL